MAGKSDRVTVSRFFPKPGTKVVNISNETKFIENSQQFSNFT